MSLTARAKDANDGRLRFLLGGSPRELNWMANSAFANAGFALVGWLYLKQRHCVRAEFALSDGL
jgi:hypothetical protein